MLMPRYFTTHEHELLLKLWRDGVPASTIASALGKGRTRNSVLGYIHRLRQKMPELQRKPTPKRTNPIKASITPRVVRPKPIPTVQVNIFTPIVEEPPPEGGVSYFETRLFQCKYILNTSKDSHNIKCCGGTVYKGSSWCRKHYEEVFIGRTGHEIQAARLLSDRTQAASRYLLRQK